MQDHKVHEGLFNHRKPGHPDPAKFKGLCRTKKFKAQVPGHGVNYNMDNLTLLLPACPEPVAWLSAAN
jgi:hypothetical protein